MGTPLDTTAARRSRGFTLVELVLAIVVLGVLAAIALPTYQDSVRKSRRGEAFNAIAALQQSQERWRGNNPTYTTTLNDLGWTTSTTPNGLYTVSLGTPAGDSAASSYIVTAVGADGSTQAEDKACRKLSVRVRGGTVEYAGCGSCAEFAYAASNPCWAR